MSRLIATLVMLMFSMQTLCFAGEWLCNDQLPSNKLVGSNSHDDAGRTQLISNLSDLGTQDNGSKHDCLDNHCDCDTCHHHLSFVPILISPQQTSIYYTDYLWPVYSLPVLAEHANTLYRPPSPL